MSSQVAEVAAKVDDMVKLASYGGSEASGSTGFLVGEPVAGIHSFLFQFENTSESWTSWPEHRHGSTEDKSTKFRPSADYLFNLSIASWPHSMCHGIWDWLGLHGGVGCVRQYLSPTFQSEAPDAQRHPTAAS